MGGHSHLGPRAAQADALPFRHHTPAKNWKFGHRFPAEGSQGPGLFPCVLRGPKGLQVADCARRMLGDISPLLWQVLELVWIGSKVRGRVTISIYMPASGAWVWRGSQRDDVLIMRCRRGHKAKEARS